MYGKGEVIFLLSLLWLKLCLAPIHSRALQEAPRQNMQGPVYKSREDGWADWSQLRRADSEKVFLSGNLERSAIERRDQTDVRVFRLASLSLGGLPLSLPCTLSQMFHPPGSALVPPLPPPLLGSLL